MTPFCSSWLGSDMIIVKEVTLVEVIIMLDGGPLGTADKIIIGDYQVY